MIKCGNDCIPCCDFCIYVIEGSLERDGTAGPIGCNLHKDEEHSQKTMKITGTGRKLW